MRKIYTALSLLLFAMTVSVSVFAQNNFFTDAGENTILQTSGLRTITPDKYRASALDVQAIRIFLWSLPSERNVVNPSLAPILELPMPNGTMAKFHVWESSIMEPGLAVKFSEMRTFAGQGIDDPYATIRFDYNPYFGFSAQILSSVSGRIFIDPYARRDINNYISYYSRDYTSTDRFICEVPDNPNRPSNIAAGPCRGDQLFTYRLALACTGEYAVAVAGASPTIPAVAAAMLTAVNRVTGVYETEASIRMVLVSNNNLLIFLDGNTDPYTNNNGGAMLSQNIATCNSVIGLANYDIGHVFSTGGGGVAFLGVICTANKAGGVTGLPNPVGDAFYIDYVAHEMGHQYGGNHTFNSVTSNCGGGNRNASTAYEVGSATTIMGYAGICGADNIQPNSDPFFHTVSFDEIGNYAAGTGGTCAVMTPTGNTLPVITAMNNNGISIPTNTPFTLSGSATDANGDALTYCWEEWDLGPGGAWNGGATSTTAPLFKSRIPKTIGERTFPDIAVILAGYPANPPATMGGLKGETLPQVARAMKFRLTVRDNRAGGGGVVTGGDGCQAGYTGTFQVNVTSSGPFLITVPNGGESYQGGSTQTITWDPALTASAPISVANVKISLSTDGGLTYPTVITASTPNDGSEALTIPAVVTTTARIKIDAIGNIFFDISNANFTVTVPPTGFSFISPAPATASCPAPATMAITLGTISNAGFTNPITLSATAGVPPGTNVTFGTNPVTPGNSSVVTLNNTNTLSFGSYVITITGIASGAPTQTVNLTYTINPGAVPVITVQPASQTVCEGSNAVFSVTASGATSYQWQLSTDGGTIYNNIGGATASTYTAVSVTAGMNNYLYRVIVTGQCGSSTSAAAVLTVQTAPSITSQPQSVTLCAGSNNTFTVVANGTGLTYQWESSATGCGGPFASIAGATSNSYTVNGITAGMNNTGYRCIISGTCTPVVTSSCALLTVVTPVTITTQPTDVTVCETLNASFTVAGSGSGIIYQWALSTNGGTLYTSIPGANSATLTLTSVTASMNGYFYIAILSNVTCITPTNSNAALLTVQTAPVISAQPQSVTLCVGSNNTFSVTATGTNITYQWQVSTDGGVTHNNIAGATSANYLLAGITAGMNNNRYRSVVSGACSPAAISNAAVLTVISPVSISPTGQPVNAEICSTSNTSFTVTGTSTQPITYQWQDSTSAHTWQNISGANSATLNLTAVTTSMNGNGYRVLLSNTTCTVPTVSNKATLTVRQLPTVGLAASSISLLPGQSSTLTATPSASTGGVLTTAWFYNSNPLTVTGNTYVANVEKIGAYQVRIQETWPSTLVCSNQSAIVTIDAPASPKLFIFPSPNDGQFTVAFYNAGGSSTQQTIAMYDSHGAKVYFGKLNITGPYRLHFIDLRPAARGIYYVVLGDASGKKLASGKMIIH